MREPTPITDYRSTLQAAHDQVAKRHQAMCDGRTLSTLEEQTRFRLFMLRNALADEMERAA